jgi:hypothetical protein
MPSKQHYQIDVPERRRRIEIVTPFGSYWMPPPPRKRAKKIGSRVAKIKGR